MSSDGQVIVPISPLLYVKPRRLRSARLFFGIVRSNFAVLIMLRSHQAANAPQLAPAQ